MSSDLLERMRDHIAMNYTTDARDDIAEAADEIERLRAQLPDGMKDCTIVFKECERGHGTLTATNWAQHECQQCEIERLCDLEDRLGLTAICQQEEIERLRAMLETANIYGAGENKARIAAEGEVAELKKANDEVNAACCKEAAEVDRLRSEVAKLELLRDIVQDVGKTMLSDIRDRIDAELKERS